MSSCDNEGNRMAAQHLINREVGFTDTVDGAWIMKGCAPSAGDRLRTPEDLLDLVMKIGFLPLFSNEIPGFSVEEHTLADDWWMDDPATDPWAWRQLLASNAHVCYGKFFDKKAGFVSREWFPDFANYRRDGYDYEGLYEDGKMKRRCKQIMDVFSPDEEGRAPEILSCDVKKRLPETKGFEGALTELQMQSFLIMADFRQRTNKFGLPYGWHVAALATPESKWGYDWVNGADRKPEASWERLQAQLLRFFPDAEEAAVRKLLGIRR